MRLSRGDLNNKSFPIKKNKYLKVMPEPEYIFLAKQDFFFLHKQKREGEIYKKKL